MSRTGCRVSVVGVMVALLGGCVQRTVTVNSNPDGALVYMNGQEVGRTPLTRDFTWYGWYDVQLRKEGYETVDTRAAVIAPIWQWPPFDLIAEFMPWHPRDKHYLVYGLRPASTQPVAASAMLARAETLRGQLQSSQYTKQATPATRPTTAPTTR